MRRTAEDAAKTRIALLKAALLSFEEKGWREATLKHIAERAGVTRGGLQHHFHDKQTLLDAALQWGWSDYGRRLFEDLDADPDGNASNHPREAIEELLSRFVRLVTGDTMFRALASTTMQVAPQALEHSKRNSILDDWHRRIEEVIVNSTGQLSLLTPTEAAGLVLTLIQGFTVTAVTRPTDLPQPDKLDTAVKALGRGLLDS